ncbi:MAG: ATP-binding cassette domain-containing protein, partial [Actinobacteria bacterium]
MPLLEARSLTAALPCEDGPRVVLDGVSLHAEAGEVVDVAGPSGAGKTTLLRALARLLPGASGDLALDGRAAAEVPPAEWR